MKLWVLCNFFLIHFIYIYILYIYIIYIYIKYRKRYIYIYIYIYQPCFQAFFLLPANSSKNSILNWVFKLNLFFLCFWKTQVIKIYENMKVVDSQLSKYLLAKQTISTYKFFGTLFGHKHSVFHHCNSLVL